MQAPIVFASTGAVARYPLGRKVKFATRAVQFNDFSGQFFSQLSEPLREWALNLSMLRDDEAQDWIEFFKAAKGQGAAFTFADPWDNLLNWTEEFENAAWSKGNLVVGKNYLLSSEDLTNVAWSAISGGGGTIPTLTANATAAPDGTNTADQIAFPATGAGQHSTLIQVTSMPRTLSQTVTASVFLKAAVATTIMLILEDPFSLTSTTTIVNVTTSWQRFSITWTTGAGVHDGSIDFQIRNIASQGAKTIFAWGAQLEYGSVQSDYTKTTSAQLELQIADPFWKAAPASSPGSSFGLNSVFPKRGRQLVRIDTTDAFLYQLCPLVAGGSGNYRAKGLSVTASLYMKQQDAALSTIPLFLYDFPQGAELVGGNCSINGSWQRFSFSQTFSASNNAPNLVLQSGVGGGPVTTGAYYVFGAQLDLDLALSRYKHNQASGGVRTSCRFADEADHSADGFDLNTLQNLTIQEWN